jgi:exopolysaccharide biosynthesis polyprenyl glycosylphosphotransferase
LNDQSPRSYRTLLIVADGLGALFALWFAALISPSFTFSPRTDLVPLVFAVIAMLAGIWSMRGYQLHRIFRIADEIVSLLAGSVVGMGIFAGLLFFTNLDLSRLAVFYFAALTPAFSMVLRVVWRLLWKWRQAPRVPTARVLIVGAGSLGHEVGAQITERNWLGLELVGYVDDHSGNGLTLGTLNELERLCREQRIDVVIVTLPLSEHGELATLLERIHKLPVQVKMAPDMYPLAYLYSRLEMFGGMPLIGLHEPVIAPWQAVIKRGLDVAIALAGLILTAPVMLAIAIAIRLTSPGPIIFSHERVGEGGRLFRMHKFRTMVQNAEQILLEEARTNEEALIKRANDPRVTPLGSWLRRFSLDELPQLWNVLTGDMSIVGPRPELPYLVERYEPWQRKRLLVPQGITGWWQINGRSEKPMLLHTEDDLYYVRNYSLLLDIEIMWKTIWVVLRGKGAY